jgi:hypothetical protein
MFTVVTSIPEHSFLALSLPLILEIPPHARPLFHVLGSLLIAFLDH